MHQPWNTAHDDTACRPSTRGLIIGGASRADIQAFQPALKLADYPRPETTFSLDEATVFPLAAGTGRQEWPIFHARRGSVALVTRRSPGPPPVGPLCGIYRHQSENRGFNAFVP